MLVQLNYFPNIYLTAFKVAISKFKCEIKDLDTIDEGYSTLTVEVSDYTELFLFGMYCGNDAATEALSKVTRNFTSTIAAEIFVNFKPL